MKYTILLCILILGCSGSLRQINTLSVTNNSGGTVRVYAHDFSTKLLGHVWPGVECLKLRAVNYSDLAFGIQHLGKDIVWTQSKFANVDGMGWRLEIHQPHMAVFDLLDLRPSERCT